MLLVWALATPGWAGSPTAIRMDAPSGLCPGEPLDPTITGEDERGRVAKVRSGPRGDVAFTWELAEPDKRGALFMPTDPRIAWGKAGVLTAELRSDPRVRATAAVPLRTDCALVADLSGAVGEMGDNGVDGVDVSDGRGGDGEHGQPGDAGRDAPEVHVRLALATEPRTGLDVLQVEVQDLDHGTSKFFALDPERGTLAVVVDGGQGGRGGAGGDAGAGGDGGSSGGRPGTGGDGGPGGRGGVVVVFLDASAVGRTRGLVVENAGGSGGPGGPGGHRAATSPNDATSGRQGSPGRSGNDGPPPQVLDAKVGRIW